MRFCLQPWCTAKVAGGYCPRHRPARREPAWRTWYHTREWRTLRARVLREFKCCPGRDDGRGCGLPTVDVDHRIPHRGDRALFWNRANLVALCHRCHAAKTGRGQ